MNHFLYLFVGIYFGIVLCKTEVVSWFRIQEMFRFDSIHMYGIIGLAILLGALSVQLIQRLGICPGPLYALIGDGYPILLVPLVSAILGALVYGLIKDKLPH